MMSLPVFSGYSSNRWFEKFSIVKPYMVIFLTGNSPLGIWCQTVVKMNNVVLVGVNFYNYLGIDIDDKLCFD